MLLGARHFDRLRANARVRAFLDGAGPGRHRGDPRLGDPARAGLSGGVAGGRARGAALLLLVARRGVVLTLLLAALSGVVVAVAGGPVPG